MAKTLDEIDAEARELSREHRTILIHRLLDSLDVDDDEELSEVESEWLVEIERRVKEIDDGTAVLVDWEVVRDQVRNRRVR